MLRSDCCGCSAMTPLASTITILCCECRNSKPRCQAGLEFIQKSLLSFCCFRRLNQDVTAAGALVDELDGACYFGKKRVILAATNVGAGLDAGAALFAKV